MARIKAKSQAAKLVDKIMQTTDETLEKTGSALTKQALVPYRTELLNVMQSTIADYRLLRSKNGKTRAIPNTGRIKDPKTLSTVKSKKLVDYGQKKVLAYFHFTQDGQSRIPIKNAKKAKLTPFTYESWLEFGTKSHAVGKGSITQHHYDQSIQYYEQKIAKARWELSSETNALGNKIQPRGIRSRLESIKRWQQRIDNKRNDPQWKVNQHGRVLPDITKYKLKLITPIRTKIKNSAISELAKQLQTEFANNISNVTK
jgi:hypothetical protein